MLIYELFEMPEGIEAAAHRFASEIHKAGFEFAQVMTCGGGVSYIDIAEGEQAHFLKLIDGVWYELFEVSEPCELPITSRLT